MKPSASPQAHSAGVLYSKKYASHLAGPDDDETLRHILRETPMQGQVSVAFCREPNFFAPSAHMGECYAYILRAKNKKDLALPDANTSLAGDPVMMYALSTMPMFFAGHAVQGSYLHLLRVLPEFRRRVGVLRDAYAAVKHYKDSLNLDGPCFTSIATDNAPARRLLEAGLPHLPSYTLAGQLETLALGVGLGKKYGLLRQATSADLPELLQFYTEHYKRRQLAPFLTEAWFKRLGSPGAPDLQLEDFYIYRKQGRIYGCLALWNQQSTRQNVIMGYAKALRLARPLYNLWAKCTRLPGLPAIRQPINSVYLAFAAFDEKELGQFLPCVQEALAVARECGFVVGLLGLNSASYLAKSLKNVRCMRYHSRIYTVHWANEIPRFLPDLDAFPEIALL